ETKELLFENCYTPAFNVHNISELPALIKAEEKQIAKEASYRVETNRDYATIKDNVITKNNLEYIIDYMAEIIIENEVAFCELDSHAGDGDFGMSVAKGFRQLKNEWSDVTNTNSISQLLENCSLVIMENCGGASGPIWGSAFRAAAKATVDHQTLDVAAFASMLDASIKGIQDTGERSFGRGAIVGDKTLIDALVPCAIAWQSASENNLSMKEAFTLGAEYAVEGASKTETFAAKMGRAGTVGDRSIGYPDAGAHALGVIFTAIANRIN
ncbi:MAG: dihydroxyacetone kinase subunit DhaL, partial [Bacilli bacterium]